MNTDFVNEKLNDGFCQSSDESAIEASLSEIDDAEFYPDLTRFTNHDNMNAELRAQARYKAHVMRMSWGNFSFSSKQHFLQFGITKVQKQLTHSENERNEPNTYSPDTDHETYRRR